MFIKIKQELKKKTKKILIFFRLTQHIKALFPWSIIHALYFAIKRQQLKFKLMYLARSNRPILIGPWISEVGFELIYWIPFLSWLCHNYQINPTSLYIVSRGGVRSWYSTISSNYVELYDFISPTEYKDHLLDRQNTLFTQKHIHFSTWDKSLLDRVSESLKLSGVAYIHPKEMFNVFQELWADGASSDLYKMLRHNRLPKESYVDISTFNLPDNYILCRFYSSKCFILDEKSLRTIREMLGRLSRNHNIVIVSPGLKLDDHSDIDIKIENITVIDNLPLTENLGIQTALIEKADMLITTYGGLSYLGILTGRPTIALHSNGKFLPSHLDTAQRASRMLNKIENMPYAEYLVLGIDAICQIIEMAERSGSKSNFQGAGTSMRLETPQDASFLLS